MGQLFQERRIQGGIHGVSTGIEANHRDLRC